MTDIQAGTIVLVKITEEPVFVIGIQDTSTYNALNLGQLSGKEVLTRRGNITDKGTISYVTERFLCEELETKDEHDSRKISELEELRAKFPRKEPITTQRELPFSN